MSEELITKEQAERDAAEAMALFDPNESVQHVQHAKIPVITIAGAGVGFYEFNDETDEEKRMQRSFQTVIIDDFMTRSYWKEELSTGGAGKRPDCFSADGRKPSDRAKEKQSESCATCPMAKFGTGKNGKRQACKLSRILMVMHPNSKVPMPAQLRLPPSSIRPVDAFFQRLAKESMPFRAAVVKFELLPNQTDNGIKYSVVKLEKVGFTPLDVAKQIRKFMDDGLLPELRARATGSDVSEVAGEDVPF